MLKVEKHHSYMDRTLAAHAQVQSIHLPDGLISAVRSFQREMRLEQSVRDCHGGPPEYVIFRFILIYFRKGS